MSENVRIAIIGAGKVGSNLGIRLARSGYPVRFGVREGKELEGVVAQCEGRAEVAGVAEAASWGDVVVLAVPAAAAVEAAHSAGNLTGKVLVDCANPVRWEDGPVLAPPPEGSVTAALAQALPGVKVLKGFSTFGAEFHLDPNLGGASVDVQLAGDDAQAKALLASIARRAGFTPVDCGPLRNAALLESLAVLWIHLALKGGQGRHVAFKLLARG